MVPSDELWFWHSGGPLELRLGGSGDRPADGPVEVLGIRHRRCWFPPASGRALFPAGQEPVLVSCVVSPGFDFADFRMA